MAQSSSSGTGAAAAMARELTPEQLIERNLRRCETAELACAEISNIFNVGLSEVALMRVENSVLNFQFPVELKAAGFIPLSSSKAVAARTATTGKPELFNNFLIVQHANVFETIKLISLGQSQGPGGSIIQKLMSAPVTDQNLSMLGVIQVCHKGLTQDQSGPDFTTADLHKLELTAHAVAKLHFMRAL